jgi:translation initiation factor 2 beta subunit (eIF-2beta)/eIF-5
VSLVQRFFLAVLPQRWADDMRAESQAWMLRCTGCGASRSVWDLGGIRWKAASVGKRTVGYCSHCGGIRAVQVEKTQANG